jgi:AcrR family transcriptional regulator
MGRKKLSEQRQQDILDAFEQCLLKYGLEASTLERVAREAGKSRNIIRHYIGNRDELLVAYMARTLTRVQTTAAQLLAATPKKRLIATVLDFFFWERSTTDEPDLGDRMLGGLWRIRERSPRLQKALLDFYLAFEKILADGLTQLFPNASAGQCQTVAYSIICLAETNWVLGGAGLDKAHTRMARHSAEALLHSLEA